MWRIQRALPLGLLQIPGCMVLFTFINKSISVAVLDGMVTGQACVLRLPFLSKEPFRLGHGEVRP